MVVVVIMAVTAIIIFLAELCRLRTCINLVNFVRIMQGTCPSGAVILVKFQIFKILGP